MSIKILAIGDVFGRSGRNIVFHELGALKKELEADFMIVNFENASGGAGVSEPNAKELLNVGSVDVYTSGNHIWDKRCLLYTSMSVLSGVLEFLLLAVLGLGIWAAALATCSGIYVCAVLAFIPFFRKKTLLRFCRPRFNGGMIRQIIACGSPNFLNNIAGRITAILMNAILVRLGGETAVSVYGVLMFAEGFILPLLYGMCDSLQPAVGYNWGAEKYSRVRAIEKYCFVASGAVSLAAAAAMAFSPELITRLFMPEAGEDILRMSVNALQLFSFTYLTRWFSFATQSYMMAIEKPGPASIISVSYTHLDVYKRQQSG